MILDLLNGGDARSILINMLLSLPVFLLSLSFHEFGHAWMASRCGDPTAVLLGRCTLNPLKHIHPVGLAMMFLVGFGYAKPVPVNPNNFENPRRDDLLVSLAGITCNLILFVIGVLLLIIMLYLRIAVGGPLFQNNWMAMLNQMIGRLITINLVLAVFNLLPVPPLDGYHVLNDLLLRKRLFAPQAAAQAGTVLLFVLMMSGWLDKGLSFVVNHVWVGVEWLAFTILHAIGVV